jgi:hypothetical protein
MRTLRYIFTTVILLFTSNTFSAGGTDSWLQISPVVGIERVQKVYPTARTRDRTIVGARLLAGPRGFRLEAEATRADDRETFADKNLTIHDESYNAMLGFRSGFQLMQSFSWYMRFGGRARKTKETRTENDVKTVKEPAIYVSPYAGTGFRISMGRALFANGGVTVIFTGKPKGSDREYQTTLGFGVSI